MSRLPRMSPMRHGRGREWQQRRERDLQEFHERLKQQRHERYLQQRRDPDLQQAAMDRALQPDAARMELQNEANFMVAAVQPAALRAGGANQDAAPNYAAADGDDDVSPAFVLEQMAQALVAILNQMPHLLPRKPCRRPG